MRDTPKVGISGVRGIAGSSFTPQLATSFAQAFGTYVGPGSVLVGRDTRRSGPMIENAVITGLQSTGCKPLLAGVVPTPTLLVMTPRLGARGGIAITASHNPEQWNALKFIDENGTFLTPSRASELYDVYHQREFRMVPEHDISEPSVPRDCVEPHFQEILNYVDIEAIRKRPVKVAADCCNGVGAIHTPRFLEHFNCDFVACGLSVTGQFDREPEPLPHNLGTLSELVTSHGADIGFAQDPDGDRLAIVDEKGTPIGEDLTVALAVRQVLDAHEKGPVVVHLSTSRCIRAVAESYGCPVHLSKIGEINVTEKMLETGAVVGGESNGGVIIPAIHPCRDSYAAMAVVLELLAKTGKRVSELRAEIPTFVLVRDKIPIEIEDAVNALRSVRRHYDDRDLNLMDGVHVDFDDRWFHTRISNTEPVVRITAEAPDEKGALALIKEVRGLIEGVANI
jgi:phosphomannomutase